ncbi:hypothetical protein [Nonomuraea sp. NPDC003727]
MVFGFVQVMVTVRGWEEACGSQTGTPGVRWKVFSYSCTANSVTAVPASSSSVSAD